MKVLVTRVASAGVLRANEKFLSFGYIPTTYIDRGQILVESRYYLLLPLSREREARRGARQSGTHLLHLQNITISHQPPLQPL